MRSDEQLQKLVDSAPKREPRRAPNAKPPDPMPGPLCAADLAQRSLPPLVFLADAWVPQGKPVLLCGKGGGGKTTLAVQLAVARALELPFLDLEVQPGVTLALLCEEDGDDAHRLLARLTKDHYNHTLAELKPVHYWPRAGEDNALVWRARTGEIRTSRLYDMLQEAIGDLKPSLLILDNARHVARVNENDGAEVTAAWSLLHGLMRPTRGTTLLLGHTPKNDSAEFSGNSAWENVARTRLYLGPECQDKDSEPAENDPRRVLRRGKSNANGTAAMKIAWHDGAFRRSEAPGGGYGELLDRQLRQGHARQVFLDALDRLTDQRRHVSHSERAGNYAPKAIVAAGLAQGFNAKELTAAMNDLFAEKRIRASQPLWPGPDRHPVLGIGKCPS